MRHPFRIKAAATTQPLAETEGWRSARTRAEREAAAGAWVRRGQATTGTEHLAVLDSNGELIRTASSGKAASVLVGKLPDRVDVVLHHSHPDETSLSGVDFVAAWKQTQRSEVRAYTPDGCVFRGRSLRPPEGWLPRRQSAIEAVGSELRVLGRRRRIVLTDATAHLVNLELAATGAVWYRHVLSRSARAVLSSLAFDRPTLGALVRAILVEGD